MAPGETPPGWEAGMPIGSEEDLRFLDCERVAWGKFERPASFVIEDHTKRVQPAACAAVGSEDVVVILSKLWTPDAELAAYLAETYGLPMGVANVSFVETGSAPAQYREWTIAPPGAQPSSMTFLRPPGPLEPSAFTLRLAWWTGEHLGFFDMAEQSIAPEPGATWAAGTIAAPLQHGSSGVTAWSGGAGWEETVDITGTIWMWKDSLCTEPL